MLVVVQLLVVVEAVVVPQLQFLQQVESVFPEGILSSPLIIHVH